MIGKRIVKIKIIVGKGIVTIKILSDEELLKLMCYLTRLRRTGLGGRRGEPYISSFDCR